MLDNFSSIRNYLLSEGFAPAADSGDKYVHRHNNITIQVDLSKETNQVQAFMPDNEYNKANPYSHKDICIDYTIDLNKGSCAAVFNLTKFFEFIVEKE